jgi:CRP-like cAMP-binding protein/predicted MFS family arabinose efflux permease
MFRAFTNYRRALGHRDFRLLATGLAVSQIGDWLFGVALVTYVYLQTHSATWVAALTLLRLLPIFVLAPIAGALADRVNRRRLLISCDLTQTALMAGMTAAAATHAPIATVFVMAILSKIVASPYQPAATAEVPNLVGERDLASANSLLSTVTNVAVVLGPLLGALTLLLGSAAAAFAVNGATFLIGTTMVARARGMSRGRRGGERKSLLAETVDGLKALKDSPAARAVMLLVFAGAFVFGADQVVFVVAAVHRFHGGAHGYGFLVTALGVGGLLAIPFADRVAAVRRAGSAIYVATAFIAIPILFLALTHSLALAAVLVGVNGFAIMLNEVGTATALQRALPNDLLARGFGAYDSSALLGIVVGTAVAGSLIHLVGIATTFVVVVLVQLALLAVASPWARVVDRASARRLDAIRDRLDVIRRLDLLVDSPRAVVEDLANVAKQVTVPPGTAVVTEGEPATAFFVVVSGRLEVTSRGELGEARVMRELTAGDYFGEIGLLMHSGRTATVTSRTECVLLEVSADGFLDAVNGSPASVRGALVQVGSQRLAQTHPVLAAAGLPEEEVPV